MRRRTGGHFSIHRLLAATLAAGYVLAAVVPLPSPTSVARWLGAAQTERFPCESCGCGCASAAGCWDHCCCHTTDQKLAWALRNGVTPPARLTFTNEQWVAAANAVRPGSASCCAKPGDIRAIFARTPAGATAPVPAVPVSSGCCSSKRPSSPVEPEREPAPAAGHAVFSALACQGLSAMPAGVVLSLPATPPCVEPAPDSESCLLPPVAPRVPASCTIDTATPPPRFTA